MMTRRIRKKGELEVNKEDGRTEEREKGGRERRRRMRKVKGGNRRKEKKITGKMRERRNENKKNQELYSVRFKLGSATVTR